MTGAELRALRTTKGYSLSALANATGKSIPTICRYQSGKRAIPQSFARLMELLPRRQ
jgi:transcriptional regulator with XRE-family HTH domain